MQDSGYCGLGDVCASIEGYCCHKDENEPICMLRLGISSSDDFKSDPNSNSDIDSEDLDSGLTSISSSSSASQSQSQSESESQSITHIKSDDESTDSDLGNESSDSDGASSPPMSMLTNALNSGPLADEDADADADADAEAGEDEDENADPDSVLHSGSDVDVDIDTGTNVNPESTTVVLSLGTAVASAMPFGVMSKDEVSSVRAWESSTLVSSWAGVESSSATAVSNANELTSSAPPSQSISEGGLNASATTSGVDGTFTGGAMRIGRESGLEGGVARSCLFLSVSFVVWVVL
ncbi:hypothetical protein BOTCAL_0058g00330 [Botryotinia calthae]|uniref:Uncharacterized protein n=1 Tax=Botryotinia calthae TaxID=38488 RepID=A0A4Y8DCN7_9HELO|nr:hypothetical protein BOTCAL_0058g00330 [Botryotinia calthae]